MSDDRDLDMNMVHVDASRLPTPLHTLARSWRQAGARVAARKDDAGEYRIMQMRPGEPVWVGWYPVNFNA